MKSIVVFLLAACVIWTGGLLAQEVEYVGSLDNPGWSNAVFVQGDYAYLACQDTSFYIIDVSDPTDPRVISDFNTPMEAIGVSVSAGYAYVLDRWNGLYILDVTNPLDPQLAAHYEDPWYSRNLFVSGSFAYIIGLEDDPSPPVMLILDVSDPTNPVLVETAPYSGNSVFVYDNAAFVAYGGCLFWEGCGGGFDIIDISDPSDPTLQGSYDTSWDPVLDIFVDGDYAYLATGGHWLFIDFGGFRIIDIRDIVNPDYVGGFGGEYSDFQFTNVFKQDDYAFVTRAGPGYWLLVLDVSPPDNPMLETAYDGPGSGSDIYVVDSYIYVASGLLTILRFIPTDIDEDESIMPSELSLSPAHPNPFNSSTTIEYTLPQESEVTIEIYDILGRRVETLVQGKQRAGSHSVTWDARKASSGVYFYRIQAGDLGAVRKMILLK